VRRYQPTEVMPQAVARAVADMPYWFVIGGHAVRCFFPYRPSRDVDFGVGDVKTLTELTRALRARGKFEVLERDVDTVHGRFEGVDVSIFVLRELRPFTENRSLSVTGLLASKLHAILDRGTRRDFFDLYVLLEGHRLGLVECLRALREVYRTADVNEGLVLRALSYFDDAEAEAPLPGEDPRDFETVKAYFQRSVGALLIAPTQPLSFASRVVDVRKDTGRPTSRPSSPKSSSPGKPRKPRNRM
jgi:predicted nucleotidyltransferase component of viral defense system